jgi:hypothetical protein
MILKCGPGVLDQMVFKSCSDDVRAIIEFVADDRADQYLKKPRTKSASSCVQLPFSGRINSNGVAGFTIFICGN